MVHFKPEQVVHFHRNNQLFLVTYLASFLLLVGCSSLQKATIIDDGKYVICKPFVTDSLQARFKDRVYIEDSSDYLVIYKMEDKEGIPIKISSEITSATPLLIRQNSFDIDLFTVPFKIRPAQADVPTQFNTSFNASMYFGYRRDIIKVSGKPQFANVSKRTVTKNGIGTGVFIGGGPVPINPTVTMGKVNQEYDGLSISCGISSIYAVEKFNAGLAIGFDYLTDKNKANWIYQNKPWIGILLGFNLN